MAAFVDMSNFPESIDVLLHPISSPRDAPGRITISKFELESLYKLYLILNSDVRFYKDQLDEVRSERECLQSEVECLQRRIEELERARHAEKIQSEKIQFDLERVNADLTSENLRLQLQIKDLEDELADNNQLPNPCQLQTVVNSLGETCRKQETEKAEMAEKQKELHDKLKEMEAFYDCVSSENKDLKKNNTRLLKKLRMLSEEDSNKDVDIKMGRFTVKRSLVECSTCHESFASEMELKQSTCHYHRCQPVPHLEGTGMFWSCCQRVSKGNKTADGCQTGRHKLSAKCFKEE